MSVPGRRALYILILLFFLGSAGIVSASGTKEDPISRAEALVEELKYNEAILILTEVMRKHPERFQEAQELLNRIREAREYYNEKYADLIQAYEGNLEDAYPIIKELEELDPDPNEAAAQSLKLAKETAGFVYNNNRFLRIMDEAGKLLDNGLYYEAIGVYATGFDLSRDIFEDENYGNIIESMVNRLVSTLQSTVSDIVAEGGGFTSLSQDLIATVKDDTPLENLLTGFQSRAADMSERRETLVRLAKEFIDTEADIRRQGPDEKQVYYLVFLNRLLEGRTDTEVPEGIIYAVERAWTERMQEVETALWDKLREVYRETDEAYTSGNYPEMRKSAEALAYYASSFAEFMPAWTDSLYMDEEFNSSSFVEDLIARKLPLYRAALLFKDVSSSYQTLADMKSAMNDMRQELGEVDTLAEVENIMTDLASVEQTIAMEMNYRRETRVKVEAYAEGPGDFTYILDFVSNMERIVAECSDDAGDLHVAVVDRKAGILLELLHEAYDRMAVNIDRGEEFLEGLVEIRGEGEQAAEVVYHYPDRALDLFSGAVDTGEKLRNDLDQVTAFLQEEDPAIRQTPPIQERFAEKNELEERLEEQMERINTLTAEAEEKTFLAARYRQEGEKKLEEARRLMEQNRFAAAKERLVSAADRFDESLFYKEDPELRRLRDESIAALYDQINDAENALVIREVRDFIVRGKALYSQGEFGEAQDILLKAANRWSDTNVEPNPEIEYWLSLTQTALSVTSGREIEDTDPLYAEMSQYLNQARADYRTGKKLITDGKKQEADVYLNKAEKNILYVQQYFPFNKEARVLNLLISRLRDEKQFLEIFKKDFNEAKQLISSNPQKAYIDLKDLEAINPDYPGMAQAILEAEYAAGIKVRPPDRTKINQSAKLYEDAFRIYTGGNRAQYPLALSLLEEAIRLNPDNVAAIRLKDNISVETGGQSTSVFSNEDQQVYLEAVNAFTSGNYPKASILVDILLQDPDNQRNTKLLELQERIEAVR